MKNDPHFMVMTRITSIRMDTGITNLTRTEEEQMSEDNRIERIEETVFLYVEDMKKEHLKNIVRSNMNDYYCNVASDEEVQIFIMEYWKPKLLN